MSGFDVTMRSQQMANQSQQFYDSQRYQSMAQTGQAIAQAPAMLQEIQIRQQDADMRLALQQQEFQGNAMKLQAMQAIDQADMSREQVRSAKLQNDAIEFDMRSKQQQLGMQQEQMYEARTANLVRAFGGGSGLARMGLKWNPQSGGIEKMSATEWADATKSASLSEKREERLQLQREFSMYNESGDEEGKQSVLERLREMEGRPAVPRQPQQPSITPEQQRTNDDQVRQLTAMLMPLGQGGSPYSPPTIGVDRFEAIAKFMVARKDELHQKASSVQKGDRKNMMVGKDADETVRMYLSELRNPNSPWRAGLLTSLVRGGVITPEEAQKLMDR